MTRSTRRALAATVHRDGVAARIRPGRGTVTYSRLAYGPRMETMSVGVVSLDHAGRPMGTPKVVTLAVPEPLDDYLRRVTFDPDAYARPARCSYCGPDGEAAWSGPDGAMACDECRDRVPDTRWTRM